VNRLIRLILVILLLILIYLIYILYFKNINKITEIKKTQKEIIEKIEKTEKNNLIKDLKYVVKIENQFNYQISSELSEIYYENTTEKIKMKNVIAKYTDDKENTIIVKSKNAIFDNNKYDTKFFGNVEVSYKKDIIFSDNLNIDFKKQFINIFSNVRYLGVNGIVNSDNVDINLKTREISINMIDKKNNIEIFFK